MALRLARAYHVERGETERWRIVSPAQAYHGATFGTLALTGRPGLQGPVRALPRAEPPHPAEHAAARRDGRAGPRRARPGHRGGGRRDDRRLLLRAGERGVPARATRRPTASGRASPSGASATASSSASTRSSPARAVPERGSPPTGFHSSPTSSPSARASAPATRRSPASSAASTSTTPSRRAPASSSTGTPGTERPSPAPSGSPSSTSSRGRTSSRTWPSGARACSTSSPRRSRASSSSARCGAGASSSGSTSSTRATASPSCPADLDAASLVDSIALERGLLVTSSHSTPDGLAGDATLLAPAYTASDERARRDGRAARRDARRGRAPRPEHAPGVSDVQYVLLAMPDMNGYLRGKALRREAFETAVEEGTVMTDLLLGLDPVDTPIDAYQDFGIRSGAGRPRRPAGARHPARADVAARMERLPGDPVLARRERVRALVARDPRPRPRRGRATSAMRCGRRSSTRCGCGMRRTSRSRAGSATRSSRRAATTSSSRPLRPRSRRSASSWPRSTPRRGPGSSSSTSRRRTGCTPPTTPPTSSWR